MKNVSIIITAIIAAMALGIRAEDAPKTAPAGEGNRPQMPKLDANGDGKVTKEEFAAGAAARAKFRFERMDENKDGKVTAEEFKAAMERMKQFAGGNAPKDAPEFAKLDANNDGSLSLDEVVAAGKAMSEKRFAEMDKNGDGVLTGDEIPKFGGGRGGPGGEHKGPPAGEQPK